MKIQFKKLPKSEVQLDIVIDEKAFEQYWDKGVKHIQEVAEVDGFRKGNVPADVIVKKYGDMVILEEMANIAMRDAYAEAMKEHTFFPVADPKITITKLAKGNPFEFTMVVAVMPDIDLPSYKKLAKDALDDKETIEVTDKDIDDVVEELRKGRAMQHAHEHEEHDHSDPNHTHDVKPEDLPPLDDTFAQSFGPDFKTVADLRTKIGENMKLEKEQKLREKRRTAIIEKLVAETKVDLPDALIENELANMLAQFKADITRYGGTWEQYLEHAKKTEDEIKSSWKDDAAKRSISQIIIHKIAEAEKLQATDEEIEVELVRLLATVQDADENRAKSYLYQALTNEKVLKFLEESK